MSIALGGSAGEEAQPGQGLTMTREQIVSTVSVRKAAVGDGIDGNGALFLGASEAVKLSLPLTSSGMINVLNYILLTSTPAQP